MNSPSRVRVYVVSVESTGLAGACERPFFGDEREVERLNADLGRACCVLKGPVDRSSSRLRRSAPRTTWSVARAGSHRDRPGRPPAPIRAGVELQLHVNAVPGWLGETAGRRCCCYCPACTSRPAPVGLRVAQRHAEPQRAVQLEMYDLPSAIGFVRRRIVRGSTTPGTGCGFPSPACSSRTPRRLVVADVFAERLLRVRDSGHRLLYSQLLAT